MALLNIFKKNPLKSLDQKKLKEAEVTLKLKSRELLGEISHIDREIKEIFNKSKEVDSRMGEISLANRIKTLTQKREMKTAAQARIEMELSAVSNLLIVKEHEADLKAAGIWEPLNKLPPNQLERQLAELQLDKQDRDSRVKTITELTSTAFTASREQEEGLEDILKAMESIKEGTMEPEAAKEMVVKQEEEE